MVTLVMSSCSLVTGHFRGVSYRQSVGKLAMNDVRLFAVLLIDLVKGKQWVIVFSLSAFLVGDDPYRLPAGVDLDRTHHQ